MKGFRTLSAEAERCVVLTLVATLAIAGQGVVVIGAASARSAAKRPSHISCRSGRTEFHKGAVRAFMVSSVDRATGGPHERLLMCSSAYGKPRLMDDGGGDAEIAPIRFALQGKRLAFELQWNSLMSPGPLVATEVGWIDLRGGPARFGTISDAIEPIETVYVLPEDVLLPVYKVNFAVAPDGWMAVIDRAREGACQLVAVLANTSRSGRLGVPHVLYTALRGGLDPASLKIDDTTVTWKTTSGSPGMALRSAGTPATGSLLAQTGGCSASPGWGRFAPKD
jgi:hypothetical protein